MHINYLISFFGFSFSNFFKLFGCCRVLLKSLKIWVETFVALRLIKGQLVSSRGQNQSHYSRESFHVSILIIVGTTRKTNPSLCHRPSTINWPNSTIWGMKWIFKNVALQSLRFIRLWVALLLVELLWDALLRIALL